jgi:guanylate kinase
MRKIVVVTAPSGAGKSTIARRVLEDIPEMQFSVSATTRPPRPSERDGIDYFFLTEQAFRERIDAGDLLEYEEVYPGRLYGTLRAEVEASTAERPVLLDVDVNGALNVKAHYGEEALCLFIAPPSLEVLEQRLRRRGTEREDAIRQRLARARMELTRAIYFDAVIINDRLDDAVAETLAHVKSFLAA